MADPWWSSVRRWTGEFRNQQRCRSPALEVLIVGQFDLSATRTPGVWSGVLAGELQRYRYVGDEGAWEGSGAFKIPVDFSLDETGYRLDFKGEGMSYAGTAAKIAGTFQHRPKGGQPEVQARSRWTSRIPGATFSRSEFRPFPSIRPSSAAWCKSRAAKATIIASIGSWRRKGVADCCFRDRSPTATCGRPSTIRSSRSVRPIWRR